jgi:hypothetical protein
MRRGVTVWKGVSRKPRPGIITGFAVDGAPTIRTGHGGEVFGNASVGLPKQTGPTQTNVWTYY